MRPSNISAKDGHMKLRTFRAANMADALTAVKNDLGPGAVILHTRSVRPSGWRRLWVKQSVEVIASDDATLAAPRLGRARSAAEKKPEHPERAPAAAASARVAYQAAGQSTSAGRARDALVAARTGGATGGGGAAALADAPPAMSAPCEMLPVRSRRRDDAPEPIGPSRLATPAPLAPQTDAARAVLHEELASIKRMVSQVLQSSTPSAASGVMPQALFNHYLKLLEAEVARDIADEIVGQVRDELTSAELADESIVRQTVLRRLADSLPIAENAAAAGRQPDGRPLTIALIGPTGVGKTTTIAKLAAAYKLRHGRKVGLVTGDTYRIAAVDQLRTYAGIISVPLKVVLTPQEMAAACASLADRDIILIDTAGRSPSDAGRLDELNSFVAAASPHETHLVLSSTASESAMLSVVERFSTLSPNRVIFTKLDEAVHFGVVLNVARRIDARLSFLTTGQEVPDHIEPSRADRLARLLLDGPSTANPPASSAECAQPVAAGRAAPRPAADSGAESHTGAAPARRAGEGKAGPRARASKKGDNGA